MTVTAENMSTELAAFRAHVREWLATNATKRKSRADSAGDADEEAGLLTQEAPTPDRGQEEVAAAKAFQAKLFDAGLAGLTWPKEYGGQGLTNDHQRVFNEEAADYELPTGVFTIGLGMCAPTLLEFGTEEQKEHVAKMLRGDEVWSQLFSEPGAGSDVASLQTRAIRDGDEWLLNGQKVWTSGAHYSDFGAVIARTNPDQPKHRGITMFLMDFKAPGVTVKPLRQITGGANFNEVFFDDVRLPASAVIGEVDEGWRAAVAMLMNERVAIGAGGGGRRGGAAGFSSLSRLAAERGLAGDAVIRQGLADLYIRERILGFVGARITEALKAGRAPGPEGSIAKLSGALLSRRSSDLAMQIAGPAAQAWPADTAKASRWAFASLSAPAGAIAGGTNEIQRNIIGERVLGLPKDPQVDRDTPFRDLKVGTQREPV